MSQLTDLIRQKFPGQYDDMKDDDLEKAVLAKHPEYQDLVKPTKVEPSADQILSSAKETLAKPDVTKPQITETKPEDKSFAQKVLDTVTQPLTDAPSRVAKHISSYINPDSTTTGVRGIGSAYIEALGDAVSGLTSPVNLALTAATGGAGYAEKAGLGEIAGALRTGTRLASVPIAASGVHQVVSGKNTSEKIAGAVQAVLGVAGMKGHLGEIADNAKAPEATPETSLNVEDYGGDIDKLRASLGASPRDLPPDLALPEEYKFAQPTIVKAPEEAAYDVARNKFNMGQDYPQNVDVSVAPKFNPKGTTGMTGSGFNPESLKGLIKGLPEGAQDVIGRQREISEPVFKDMKSAGAFSGDRDIQAGTPLFKESKVDTTTGEEIPSEESPTPKELNPGETDFLTKAANLGSGTTRMVLGFHIPKTAFSFHGVNEAVRNTLFGEDFNPIKAAGRLTDAVNYIFRPGAAEDFLNTNKDELYKAMDEGGLTVDIGDVQHPGFFKGDNILTKGINAFTDPKPLFQQVIPALKLKSYQRLRQSYLDSGIEPSKASKIAGYATNNIFGGMNLRALERSPATQKLFRATLLAPDWLESNLRLGGGMANALKNPLSPQGKVYRVGMANFLGAYVAANVLNAYNNNGKFSFQNDVGHELDIAIGKDSKGRVRYFSPFGTSMQMFSIPIAVAHAALQGNMGEFFNRMRSRASEPLQGLMDLATNTDFAGNPLYGKTKYNRPMSAGQQLTNIGGDIAGHAVPLGVENLVGAAMGKTSPEEATSRMLQLPMSYRFPTRRVR